MEFAPPVDYKEPERPQKRDEEMNVDVSDMMPEPSGFVAFRGQGNRLDGKRRKDSTGSDPPPTKPVYVRGIPDYDYAPGTLKFLRNSKKKSENKENAEEFKAFTGKANSLRKANK